MANARAKKKAKSKKAVAPTAKKVAKKAPAKKAPAKKMVAKKKPAAAKKAAAPVKKKKVVAAKKQAPALAKKAPVAAKKPASLHPTVKSALAQADVEGLINRLPSPVQPIVKSLRALVLENAPEASEKLEDGAPAYFANGLFARIVPEERSVLVKFLKGGQLPSASELIGDTFHITDFDEVKQNVLRKLVREAVFENLREVPAANA